MVSMAEDNGSCLDRMTVGSTTARRQMIDYGSVVEAEK